MCSTDLFLAFLAILFPPLAVWVKTGICSADSLINILLCMLGFLPGLLHAWYIIAKYPDLEAYDVLPQDAEGGNRVTYIYVQTPGAAPPHQGQGYGTVKPMEAPTLQQQQNGTWGQGSTSEGHAESSAAPPPTYAQAVTGDHKVQTHE